MNVLFVTYDFPYPMTSGGKNRAYHLLKYTAKKANLFLYSFVRDDYNPDFNEEILTLGVKGIKVHKRKSVKSFSNFPKTLIKNTSIFKTLYFEENVLIELLELIKKEKIDIIHFESSYTGFYIGEILKKSGVKIVLGTENIEYLLYFDYMKYNKNFFLNPLIYMQAKRLKSEEENMMKEADLVTVVTMQEKSLVTESLNINPEIVANGIDTREFTYSYHNKRTNNLLFVGNFTYFPNVEGIKYFLKNIFYKLDKNLTLTVIGKKAESKLKLSDKRIIVKEFVEDLRAEYQSADLLVFPIRIGGGTNFKILEAMALGLPVVAVPHRLVGLNATDGEHFLSADTPERYISQIERIYSDSQLRESLAKNARTLIEKNYEWEGIGRELLSVWTKNEKN